MTLASPEHVPVNALVLEAEQLQQSRQREKMSILLSRRARISRLQHCLMSWNAAAQRQKADALRALMRDFGSESIALSRRLDELIADGLRSQDASRTPDASGTEPEPEMHPKAVARNSDPWDMVAKLEGQLEVSRARVREFQSPPHADVRRQEAKLDSGMLADLVVKNTFLEYRKSAPALRSTSAPAVLSKAVIAADSAVAASTAVRVSNADGQSSDVHSKSTVSEQVWQRRPRSQPELKPQGMHDTGNRRMPQWHRNSSAFE